MTVSRTVFIRLHCNLKRYDLVSLSKAIKIWITNFEKTGFVSKNNNVRKKTIRASENVVDLRTAFIRV